MYEGNAEGQLSDRASFNDENSTLNLETSMFQAQEIFDGEHVDITLIVR